MRFRQVSLVGTLIVITLASLTAPAFAQSGSIARYLLRPRNWIAVTTSQSNNNSVASVLKFPRIVAQAALTGQIGPVPQTTVLTPSTSGFYRVSVYLAEASSPGSDSPELMLYWTDEIGPQQCNQFQCPVLNPGSPESNASGVLLVRAIAGTPIAFSVSGLSGGSLPRYNVFVTVEQLQ